MKKAERIEKYIRETFEMYGLDYEQFASESTSIEDIPEELREIKNGLNMYAVTEAAKVLGVSVDALMNMDDEETAKWYKKYPYFFHITGFDYAYERSFHNDQYDTLRLMEVLWDEPCTPQQPTRYDYKDVIRRLDELLREVDKSIPGTYHKDARMTWLRLHTEYFCHYDKIDVLVNSYIDMVKRVQELFFKAWETELMPEEICEYNFLVSTIGITDQEYLLQKPLHYDLLKKFIPVYREEGYNDFFAFVRIDKHRVLRPWRCAEFVLNKDLVQRFTDIYPKAKSEMRIFSMQVSKYQCNFTWSDAEIWDIPETPEGLGWALDNLELLKKNGGREITSVYVPKTSDDLNGDDRFAEMLRVLSGPAKLGGVEAQHRATDDLPWSEKFKRMQARVEAAHRKEASNE